MTDHTENSLSAVITSLRNIVGPAVDSSDPLAQQQLELSLAYLGFLKDRLPNLPDRDRFEVLHNVRLAEAALHAVGAGAPELVESLTAAVNDGKKVTATAGATRDGLRSAAAILAARLNELIERDLDDGTRRSLERAVVDASTERVDFDRAWYLPMGFDPEPATASPLRDLLPNPS